MKNKSKNKLDEKVTTGQFILSEQAVQSKPPIDKKKLLAEKEKNKADKKAKKGEVFRLFNLLIIILHEWLVTSFINEKLCLWHTDAIAEQGVGKDDFHSSISHYNL